MAVWTLWWDRAGGDGLNMQQFVIREAMSSGGSNAAQLPVAAERAQRVWSVYLTAVARAR